MKDPEVMGQGALPEDELEEPEAFDPLAPDPEDPDDEPEEVVDLMLAGAHVDLELPPRVSERDAITSSAVLNKGPQTAILILAAATFLCWPRGRSMKGAPPYRHDLLAYGADVFDFVVAHAEARGISMMTVKAELSAAGHRAIQLCLDQVVSQEDLVKARGNSKIRSAARGSGSSSGSNGSTAGGRRAG